MTYSERKKTATKLAMLLWGVMALFVGVIIVIIAGICFPTIVLHASRPASPVTNGQTSELPPAGVNIDITRVSLFGCIHTHQHAENVTLAKVVHDRSGTDSNASAGVSEVYLTCDDGAVGVLGFQSSMMEEEKQKMADNINAFIVSSRSEWNATFPMHENPVWFGVCLLIFGSTVVYAVRRWVYGIRR